jgi:hypothetical protein
MADVTADIDRIIAFFNARRMDLPDTFFDRRTQFVLNGAPFETLLGQSPDDPLILMLARGPAGFRFTTKALQHAIPDSKLEKGDIETVASGLAFQLRLSGTLRGTGEAVNTVVPVTLKLNASGSVEIAAAAVDVEALENIKQARLRA